MLQAEEFGVRVDEEPDMTIILTISSDSDIVVAADTLVVSGTDLGASRSYQGKLVKIPNASWVIGGSGQGSVFSLIDAIVGEVSNNVLKLDADIRVAQMQIASRVRELAAPFGDLKRMSLLLAGLAPDGEPHVYRWQPGQVPDRVGITSGIGSSVNTALSFLTEFYPLAKNDLEKRIQLAEFVCYTISRFEPMVGGKTGVWLIDKDGIKDVSGDQEKSKLRVDDIWLGFAKQIFAN